MPRTKTEPTTPEDGSATPEVLTLPEAARFLRISKDLLLRMVREQGLPGREIGSEWRFSKAALLGWLRAPRSQSNQGPLLEMAGAFKDDPFLEEIVREAYRQRGRPITEEGE